MTRGVVAIVAQETARFAMFTHSLTQLDLPAGSSFRWRFGWDMADVHNALIEEMLADPANDWIWFMADDHAFSPDIVRKLLAHDLDMVVPLCLMRNPPYRPVNWVTDSEAPDGVTRIDLDDYPDGGLVELAYAGAAGLLVRRYVLEGMTAPWFETGTGITNRVGEDVNFCRKARVAGYQIFCDLDTHLGHCTTTVVWPVKEHDGWTYAFSMMGGYSITLPPKVGWKLADVHA